MTLKIFYDKTTWRGFYPPREPSIKQPTWAFVNDMEDYEQAYAEAKANALEVVNYGEIYTIINDNLDREITLPCTEIDGVEYFNWPGSAVIKDGKYILSL